MDLPVNLKELVDKFDEPGVEAIVLMGSYAAGKAGIFSDIDLVRLINKDSKLASKTGSHLINGTLVVVSNVSPSQIEQWFSNPEIAVKVITGVRTARPLLDRTGNFVKMQARAKAFKWDEQMQEKANAWASSQMVGWIEEVHKGLEGLRRGDVGRMLNARFGCSWGLSNVLQVQKGILISGDNGFYNEVAQAVGLNSEWVELRREAFGIEDKDGQAPTLRQQTIAGLRLYVVTANLINEAINQKDLVLVKQTIDLINQQLK
jgi:hypothetical protein